MNKKPEDVRINKAKPVVRKIPLYCNNIIRNWKPLQSRSGARIGGTSITAPGGPYSGLRNTAPRG